MNMTKSCKEGMAENLRRSGSIKQAQNSTPWMTFHCEVSIKFYPFFLDLLHTISVHVWDALVDCTFALHVRDIKWAKKRSTRVVATFKKQFLVSKVDQLHLQVAEPRTSRLIFFLSLRQNLLLFFGCQTFWGYRISITSSFLLSSILARFSKPDTFNSVSLTFSSSLSFSNPLSISPTLNSSLSQIIWLFLWHSVSLW